MTYTSSLLGGIDGGNKSQGTAAILSALFGVFGVDKFYTGRWELGLLQLLLTLSIVGSFISIPWALLSTIILVIGILRKKPLTGIYPQPLSPNSWSDITDFDTIVAWVIIIIAVITIIFGSMKRKETFRTIKQRLNKNRDIN